MFNTTGLQANVFNLAGIPIQNPCLLYQRIQASMAKVWIWPAASERYHTTLTSLTTLLTMATVMATLTWRVLPQVPLPMKKTCTTAMDTQVTTAMAAPASTATRAWWAASMKTAAPSAVSMEMATTQTRTAPRSSSGDASSPPFQKVMSQHSWHSHFCVQLLLLIIYYAFNTYLAQDIRNPEKGTEIAGKDYS